MSFVYSFSQEIDKNLLTKEVIDLFENGSPRKINYLNNELKIIITEKYSFWGDLIYRYQFDPKTEKKDGPFVENPFYLFLSIEGAQVNDRGYKNFLHSFRFNEKDYLFRSFSMFDFRNKLNEGRYQQGILVDCKDCNHIINKDGDQYQYLSNENFIEEYRYYNNYNYDDYLIRNGTIKNGRYVGDLSFNEIKEKSITIEDLDSVRTNFSTFYNMELLQIDSKEVITYYTTNTLYTIKYDEQGYVQDGIYHIGETDFYYKDKILTGVQRNNSNSKISKDSIYSENKLWKIDNNIVKNNGWITSNKEINLLYPMNNIVFNNTSNEEVLRIDNYGKGYEFNRPEHLTKTISLVSDQTEIDSKKLESERKYLSKYSDRGNTFQMPGILSFKPLKPTKSDLNGIYSLFDNDNLRNYLLSIVAVFYKIPRDFSDITPESIRYLKNLPSGWTLSDIYRASNIWKNTYSINLSETIQSSEPFGYMEIDFSDWVVNLKSFIENYTPSEEEIQITLKQEIISEKWIDLKGILVDFINRNEFNKKVFLDKEKYNDGTYGRYNNLIFSNEHFGLEIPLQSSTNFRYSSSFVYGDILDGGYLEYSMETDKTGFDKFMYEFLLKHCTSVQNKDLSPFLSKNYDQLDKMVNDSKEIFDIDNLDSIFEFLDYNFTILEQNIKFVQEKIDYISLYPLVKFNHDTLGKKFIKSFDSEFGKNSFKIFTSYYYLNPEWYNYSYSEFESKKEQTIRWKDDLPILNLSEILEMHPDYIKHINSSTIKNVKTFLENHTTK